MKTPPIITMCGSSRFVNEQAILAWELEKQGNIVLVGTRLLPLGPGVVPDHQAEHDNVAEQMDELHLRKIDLADEVLIVNVGGYIGTSTQRELAYARSIGKPVSFVEP